MDFRNIIEFFKDSFKYILVVVVVLFIFIYVISIQQVVGPSMNTTLSSGNIVLVDKLTYKFKNPSRNQVVVFNNGMDKNLIKRVIGLPGENVYYENNYLYIDGKKYEETYLNGVVTNDFKLQDICNKTEDIQTCEVIPDGYYLVLGDNRENSMDSRSFGLIKRSDIIGRASIRMFPINKIKFIK